MGDQAGLACSEELFLAGLPASATHREYRRHETARLGADHACIGGWLLRQWRLPETLCAAVGSSHSPGSIDSGTEAARFWRCVALAGDLADFFLLEADAPMLAQLAEAAQRLLGFDAAGCGQVLATVARLLREKTHGFAQHAIRVTASLGLAVSGQPQPLRNAQALLRVAERAL